MTEEQMVVVIMAILAGTIFAGMVFSKIVDLIKTWINRKNTSIDEEEFDRLAQAFIKFKKSSEKRIQNLEAITANESKRGTETNTSQKKKISLDEKQNTGSGEGANLRNMLRE